MGPRFGWFRETTPQVDVFGPPANLCAREGGYGADWLMPADREARLVVLVAP